MTPGARLRAALARPRITVIPGAFDALSAKLVERAGFAAVYLSGAGVSYTHLAKPDLGFVTLTEMASRGAAMADAVGIPVLADGDTGFGNAIGVQRTVREYERAGLAGIQLEDQTFPKRCGHLAGKEVTDAAEMAGKIRAAADARRDGDLVIVARTDALATHGFDEAVRRLRLYADAGADVLFAEGPTSVEELRALPPLFTKPLLANMVEGGRTPLLSASELEAMGYRIALYPNSLVRLFARQGATLLDALREAGTTAGSFGSMLSFDALNALLGTPELVAAGEGYAGTERR